MKKQHYKYDTGNYERMKRKCLNLTLKRNFKTSVYEMWETLKGKIQLAVNRNIPQVKISWTWYQGRGEENCT